MTKEEIEQYIELDNKIKNRIVQISHALKDVKGNSISKFIQGFSDDWNLETYDKKDFLKIHVKIKNCIQVQTAIMLMADGGVILIKVF